MSYFYRISSFFETYIVTILVTSNMFTVWPLVRAYLVNSLCVLISSFLYFVFICIAWPLHLWWFMHNHCVCMFLSPFCLSHRQLIPIIHLSTCLFFFCRLPPYLICTLRQYLWIYSTITWLIYSSICTFIHLLFES